MLGEKYRISQTIMQGKNQGERNIERRRNASLKNLREWCGCSNNKLFKAEVLKSKNRPDDCQPSKGRRHLKKKNRNSKSFGIKGLKNISVQVKCMYIYLLVLRRIKPPKHVNNVWKSLSESRGTIIRLNGPCSHGCYNKIPSGREIWAQQLSEIWYYNFSPHIKRAYDWFVLFWSEMGADRCTTTDLPI